MVAESLFRAAMWAPNIDEYVFNRPRWTLQQTEGNEHKLGLSSRILLRPFEHGPSAPVRRVDENWAGVDMMYHLDGRWHRQSLVYFGTARPGDLAYRHTGIRM